MTSTSPSSSSSTISFSSFLSLLPLSSLLSHIATAKSLHYHHIADRLIQTLMTLPMNEVMQNSEKEEEISLIMKWNKEFQKKYSSLLTKPEEFELFNEFLPFNTNVSDISLGFSTSTTEQNQLSFDDTLIPII
jgi:hypothetical protein